MLASQEAPHMAVLEYYTVKGYPQHFAVLLTHSVALCLLMQLHVLCKPQASACSMHEDKFELR